MGAGAAISIGMLSATPADAENYAGLHPNGLTGCDQVNEPGDYVYRADNATHYYGFTGATDEMKDASNWAANNAIDPTAMNAVLTSTPGDATDIKITDYPYESLCGLDWSDGPGYAGLVGLTTCRDALSNGRCQQHIVRYNTKWTSDTSQANRRGLACHEMGHSLGLKHRESSNSCMPRSIPPPVNEYSPHDRDHLSSDY